MGLLKEGIVVDGFRVESVSVMHIGVDKGIYEYPTEMAVEGKGNADRVRRAFKVYFNIRKTIFSGYGNPYQCVPGRIQVRELGNGRFLITTRGRCVRIFLRDELERFMEHLCEKDLIAEGMDNVDWKKLIEDYIENY